MKRFSTRSAAVFVALCVPGALGSSGGGATDRASEGASRGIAGAWSPAGTEDEAKRGGKPDRIGVGCATESEASARVAEERILRLEALLSAQQERIRQLEERAVAAVEQDQDAARIEVMRRQIREILGEASFRESLMPSTLLAGYDGGFFIRDAAGAFKLQINGQLQFRWTHYGTQRDNRWLSPGEQRDDRTGFDQQRTRLMFKGHAYSKDLTYNVTIQADAADRYDFRIQYAYMNYRVADELQFRAGIFRLASTRVQFQSDANLNTIDRPMTDAVFGLGIGTGVRVWGEIFEKKLCWFIDVANSLNSSDNRVITPDPAELDGNPAVLFRTIWHAVGEASEFRYDGDLEHHASPVADVGFHYAFNDDQGDLNTTRIVYPAPRLRLDRGGFGLTNSNGLQLHQFGLDAGFKYRGFSAIGEYILRIQDVRRAGRTPYTSLWLLTGDGSTNVQHGAYAQFGYFLPIPGWENKLEAIARVGGISALAGRQEGVWEYTGGVNYYIRGNNVKLQADVTKVYEVPISSSYSSLATVNDDALIFRVQLSVLF